MPENSVEGFVHAVSTGANAIELDVHITQDREIAVVHDPIVAEPFYRHPQNIRKMSIYESPSSLLVQWIFGELPDQKFPRQKKMKTHIPLLQHVVEAVEAYLVDHSLPHICYDIEIKSEPCNYGILQPHPSELCRIIIEKIRSLKISDRCILRSFDFNIIRILHEEYRDYPVCLITENNLSFRINTERLGFMPDFYSPVYTSCTDSDINECKRYGVRILPWTVNEPHLMRKFIELGVDGIVTDYPDILKDMHKND